MGEAVPTCRDAGLSAKASASPSSSDMAPSSALGSAVGGSRTCSSRCSAWNEKPRQCSGSLADGYLGAKTQSLGMVDAAGASQRRTSSRASCSAPTSGCPSARARLTIPALSSRAASSTCLSKSSRSALRRTTAQPQVCLGVQYTAVGQARARAIDVWFRTTAVAMHASPVFYSRSCVRSRRRCVRSSGMGTIGALSAGRDRCAHGERHFSRPRAQFICTVARRDCCGQDKTPGSWKHVHPQPDEAPSHLRIRGAPT